MLGIPLKPVMTVTSAGTSTVYRPAAKWGLMLISVNSTVRVLPSLPTYSTLTGR